MKVEIVSKTHGVGETEGRSLEEIIVYCARVSSARDNKFEKSEGLLKYCIENKHWSIFETGALTFEVTTSLAIATQMIRHHSFRFQQFSMRYSKALGFEPVSIRKKAEKNRQSSMDVFNPDIHYRLKEEGNLDVKADVAIEHFLDQAKMLYNSLLEAGVAKECARMILPVGSTTKMYVTGDVRSWIHFIGARDNEHAQLEIQLIAKEIKKHLIKELPIISRTLGWNVEITEEEKV